MKLMGLGVKQGDHVTVAAEGPAEEEAITAMKKFFGASVDAQGIGDGVLEVFHGNTSFLLKFNFHAVIGR